MPRRPESPIGMLLAICTAGAAAALSTLAGAAHPGTTGVTWSGTAGRILQARCVGCHGPTGVARPRLDDYEEARRASPAIKRAVLRGHLPRWYAAPGFGEFGNDPSLSPHEIEMLAQWADGRAPRGSSSPPPSELTPDAGIAEPSLVLRVPSKHRITGRPQTFELATGLARDAWIRGWSFEPGHPALVAGAVVALDSGQTLGTWSPGDSPALLPEGAAYFLPAHSTIRLTVHYHPAPGPAVDASRIELFLGERPARAVQQMTLPCGATRLTRGIDALAIRPAVTAAGVSLAVLARRPDRSIEPLAFFKAFPADHTRTYRFREALSLPKGTSIEVQAADAPCAAELEYVAAGGGLAPPPPAETAGAAGVTHAEFWCPMHADVRADAAGACDRCGMPLVPMQPRVDGSYWLDAGLEPRGLQPGEPGMLRLVVREPRTRAVVREFEDVHERRLHLFIVSEDLQEFWHEHPVAQQDGSLVLPITLRRPGVYRLFADFLPVGGTPQMIGRTLIVGAAPVRAAGTEQRRLVTDAAVAVADGLRVRLHYESGALVAGDPSLLAFSLEDAATGLPVADLEPYLGAWGHVFIAGSDLARAVHSHPAAPLSAPPGSKIYFSQRFPRAGTYRLWAQFQRAGFIATVSFTLAVIDRVSIT